MSRKKLRKPIWREGHRRSPRISASKAQNVNVSVNETHPNFGVSHSHSKSSKISGSGAQAQTQTQTQGPATRTRATKKRRLKPLQDVASTSTSLSPRPLQQQLKDGTKPIYKDHHTDSDQPVVARSEDSPRNEDHATYTNEPSRMPSAPWMPEKRILELVLDVLQRRDTHEIFAEPVDPNEAEDYYEIIEEPMDFGTMRAKLHEGMYRSLEQFENDVFLIPKNAMHFNSSATIYFRQARAIHELATKIFHVLKTDPENFESEFSETKRRRRRSGRRPQSEARGSIKASLPKLPTNVKSSSMTIDISSNTIPSFRNSSNLGRSFQLNSQCSGIATCIDAIDPELLSGAKDGRRFSSFEVDRRCTYRPWMSFLNENESIFSTIYSSLKPLERVSQQDIGYRESLMLFVEGLGPTAKMIAERKLLGQSADASNYQTSNYWFQAQKCHADMASNPAQWGPSTHNTISKTPTSQNFLDHHYGKPSLLNNSCDTMNLGDAGKRKEANVGEAHASDEKKFLNVLGKNKIYEDRSWDFPFGSYSSTASTGDSNCLGAEFPNTGNKSTTLELNKGNFDHQAQLLDSASELIKSTESESLSKNSYASLSSWPLRTLGRNGLSSFSQTKDSMPNSSLVYLVGHDQAIAAQGSGDGVWSSSKSGQILKSDQPVPQASQFIFDLPYLKTRLDQMSACSEGTSCAKMSYQTSSTCTRQVELSNQPHSDNQQPSSIGSHHTDLALQL